MKNEYLRLIKVLREDEDLIDLDVKGYELIRQNNSEYTLRFFYKDQAHHVVVTEDDINYNKLGIILKIERYIDERYNTAN